MNACTQPAHQSATFAVRLADAEAEDEGREGMPTLSASIGSCDWQSQMYVPSVLSSADADTVCTRSSGRFLIRQLEQSVTSSTPSLLPHRNKLRASCAASITIGASTASATSGPQLNTLSCVW